MVTFQVEPVEYCWGELEPMAKAHWASTASYRRHEPFSPDRTRYERYNEMGFFHLVTAREGARLVGYFGLYLAPSMHSQLLTATEDTFYIHPEYRQGRLAVRMLKYVESYCRILGVHELLFSCEIDNVSGIDKLLTRLLDFTPVIVQYSKQLSPPIHGADSAATVADVGRHVTA